MLKRNPSDDDRAAPGMAKMKDHENAEARAQEERGLRLLHGVRAPRGLTPEQVRRIASRLDTANAGPARRRSLLPALAAVALLLSAGTALAWATGTLERLPAVSALFTAPRIAERPPSPTTAEAAVQPIPMAAPPEQAPGADLEQPAAPKPARREDDRPDPLLLPGHRRASHPPAALAARQERAAPRESSNPPATSPLMPDNPIAQEGESFANVLRTWRRAHEGRAALVALDLHDRDFPRGQMALESRLLRVEILVSERRDREALAVLDGLALGKGDVPRGRELLTVRGELRIKAGRCDDGRADLATLAGGTDGFAERARNALTHCR